MQAKAPLNVIVAGGSLGGLFAGLALKQSGHNVLILEHNTTPLLQNQGAGVVAGSDTQAFFQHYDLTKTPLTVVSPKRQYFNHAGSIIHEEEWIQRMTSWNLMYHVLRANFDSFESDYCPLPPAGAHDGQARYHYGCTVTGVSTTSIDSKDERIYDDEEAGGEEERGVKVQYRDKDGVSHVADADLVIAADGPSSTIRTLLEPHIKREYVGYVAWRGTVHERLLSPSTSADLVEKFTFYHSPGRQFLAYLIPGENGTIKPGERLMNWVWYCNYPSNSSAYDAIMTDVDGIKHTITLPVGKMDPLIWTKQKEEAEETLPPQFAEVVQRTKQPFIQAITDVISPRQIYWAGRLVLLGDAAAGFRPHTAASTSQAAYHAMRLAEYLDGILARDKWEDLCMAYSREVQAKGITMGDRSQFGKHPLADSGGARSTDILQTMARSR